MQRRQNSVIRPRSSAADAVTRDDKKIPNVEAVDYRLKITTQDLHISRQVDLTINRLFSTSALIRSQFNAYHSIASSIDRVRCVRRVRRSAEIYETIEKPRAINMNFVRINFILERQE
jgi:hypothetical protein